jgi:hypothetical protein
VESGKWRNLEKLGKNKKNVSPKRQKRDGKEGSLLGRGGSESRKKKSLVEFFFIKAAFAAVTCHAKHGFSGQTPKKKKMKQQQR